MFEIQDQCACALSGPLGQDTYVIVAMVCNHGNRFYLLKTGVWNEYHEKKSTGLYAG